MLNKYLILIIILGIIGIFTYVQIHDVVDFTPQTIRSSWGGVGCLGICSQHILTITANKTTFSELTGDPSQNSIREFQTTDEQWKNLTNLINFEKFNTLPDVIGGPGDTDAPIWRIEISDGIRTKKVTFESLNELSEMKYLALELEILKSVIHHTNNSSSQIDDIVNCSSIEVYRVPESRLRNHDDFMEFSLTELSQAPLLKNLIDKVDKIEFGLIGNTEMSTLTKTNVETSDLSWNFQWFNDKKIEKIGTYVGPDTIHFNDNFYGFHFNVCYRSP